ncbi:2-phospho-L-lactate guanylyltransferase, partial [Streptomyces nanshensis]
KEAGLDSIPGTAAEILDDEVRWILTKGKLPTATWLDVVTTAHEVGLGSTSTMMYGHVDQPRHWLGHLRLLARTQQSAREKGLAGFSEFVTLPFIHTNAPVYLAGIARPGPTARENRAVTAMARLLLHPWIPNIQTSWVKLGTEGAAEMLRSGANDLGGTLMEETISRMAGSSYGSYRSIKDLVAIADAAGRPARPRTTGYGAVPAERVAAAHASDGRLPELLPLV